MWVSVTNGQLLDATTPNDILVFNILASAAEFEKNNDAQRIRGGLNMRKNIRLKPVIRLAWKQPR